MKYDIMDCIIGHGDKVKFSQQGIPKKCKQCENKEQEVKVERKSKQARIREFNQLSRL